MPTYTPQRAIEPTINVCGNEVPIAAYWRIIDLWDQGCSTVSILQQVLQHTRSRNIGLIGDIIDQVIDNQIRVRRVASITDGASVVEDRSTVITHSVDTPAGLKRSNDVMKRGHREEIRPETRQVERQHGKDVKRDGACGNKDDDDDDECPCDAIVSWLTEVEEESEYKNGREHRPDPPGQVTAQGKGKAKLRPTKEDPPARLVSPSGRATNNYNMNNNTSNDQGDNHPDEPTGRGKKISKPRGHQSRGAGDDWSTKKAGVSS